MDAAEAGGALRRWGVGLLAGLLTTVLGVLLALGAGGGERREPSLGPLPPPEQARPAVDGSWVGTWSAAPAGAEPGTREGLPDASVRNVVHTSVGGNRVRIELSNRYGSQPVTFTHATVALAAGQGPAARPESMRTLTFDARRSVTLPPGSSVHSDAVALEVPPAANLLVTVYAPEPSGPVTYHRLARQTNYLARGEHTADATGSAYRHTSPHWRYLTGVDVLSAGADGAVAVLGDSLTDGSSSTVGANRRWTDALAERLRQEPDAPRLAVLNQGVSGNRLLQDSAPERLFSGASGLRRLHTDVLPAEGVRTVVLQLGINDLKAQREADPLAILEGMRELAVAASAEGLHVVGTTLTPFGGHPSHRADLERARQQVNSHLRSGELFHAVIDLDAALRDPRHPERLRPAYDSGDGLHPSDAGYAAMAAAVDLRTLLPEREPRSNG